MKASLTNLAFVVAGYAIWRRADYLYVVEDEHAWWLEPLLLATLLVCFAANVWMIKGPLWRRSLLALAACVAACLMLLALILTFGIPYHFSEIWSRVVDEKS